MTRDECNKVVSMATTFVTELASLAKSEVEGYISTEYAFIRGESLAEQFVKQLKGMIDEE